MKKKSQMAPEITEIPTSVFKNIYTEKNQNYEDCFGTMGRVVD